METEQAWELLEKAGLGNHFTEPGLANLLEYFDDGLNEDDGESYEFDAVQVCKDWKEYGTGCKYSFEDLRQDFKDVLSGEGLTDGDYMEKLVEKLEDSQTQWVFTGNGNIILSTFWG
jgi:hypothetical protein|nr:MAG TPA: hypothetical protein [Caudoviricetes sp.]